MAAINLHASNSSTQSPDFFHIYGPTIASTVTTLSVGLACIAKFAFNSNPWALGFTIAGALPGVYFGKKLYDDWIPGCLRMARGEIVRKITGVPNPKLGLDGWQKDSTHSNHFDQELADALVAMCKKRQLTTSINFGCGGKGQYSRTLKNSGIDAEASDFSRGSESNQISHTTLTQMESEKEYDLVTSFEVMSKTLPGQERDFVQKLINATKEGGVIAMSCAVPGQRGPNSNLLTNNEVRALFKEKGCTYDEDATIRLRKAVHGVHTWLNTNIMVFTRN